MEACKNRDYTTGHWGEIMQRWLKKDYKDAKNYFKDNPAGWKAYRRRSAGNGRMWKKKPTRRQNLKLEIALLFINILRRHYMISVVKRKKKM